jgi:3'-phosphoadenosine 5'-phosphosulfate sulfotransferase (PAPS reductase)/FAD synthetase
MIEIVVPVSGGKDSQACLKLAVQTHPKDKVIGLFCDTNFEHPKNYAHVKQLEKLYGVEIETVSGGSVEEKCLKYGRFPGGGARHCTDELKIRETKIFCRELAKKQGGFQVWYGMRSEESGERKKRYAGKIDEDLYDPHEVMPGKYPKYLSRMGIKFKLPILSWSEKQVFDFLSGEENELYREGFERVGCFPCLAGGDYWKEKAFNHDDFGKRQYIKVLDISKKIGKSIWTSQQGKFRNESGQGCLICNI